MGPEIGYSNKFPVSLMVRGSHFEVVGDSRTHGYEECPEDFNPV